MNEELQIAWQLIKDGTVAGALIMFAVLFPTGFGLGLLYNRYARRSRLRDMRHADPDGRNVGPPEIHEPVDGGASRLQMHLLGEGHHPRCQHYEWGPCTCALWKRGGQ